MKTTKISIVILGALAAVAGAFTSCSSEDDDTLLQPEKENGQQGTITVTAGIDTDATRIALGESDGGKTKVLWSTDDQIALVAMSDQFYTFSRSDENTDNVPSADFSYTGELPEFDAENSYFQYPAVEAPDIYSYGEQSGTLDEVSGFMTLRADLPEGATSYDGLNLKFTHETAVMKLTLTNENLAGKEVAVGLEFYFEGYEEGSHILIRLGEYETEEDGETVYKSVLTADAAGTVTAYCVIPVEQFKAGYAVTEEQQTLIVAEGSIVSVYAMDDTQTLYSTPLPAGKELKAGSLIKLTRDNLVPPYEYDEATNTYTVYTAYGLYAWSDAVCEDESTNLTLGADIVMPTPEEGEVNWSPVGESGNPYYGNIQGNGHTISGLVINSDNDLGIGFIGTLGMKVSISNLKLADVSVTSSTGSAGGLVGICYGNVSDCEVSGTVSSTGEHAGGLIGVQQNAYGTFTITGCKNYASVSAYSYAGGIIGYCAVERFAGGEVNFTNCTNYSSNIEGKNKGYIAGFIFGDGATLSGNTDESDSGLNEVGITY